MADYITRKKTLMGKNYEVEVPLEQYGGSIVRVHAIPDMTLARIESRTHYRLADAIAALSSADLSEEDIKDITAEQGTPDGNVEGQPPEKSDASEKAKKSAELIGKASAVLTPELTLFLGELCIASIVPNPDCACKGKGCQECDMKLMVEEFTGFTIMSVGMAAIGASTAKWQDIEDFFSQKKVQSGAGSSAPAQV